MKEVRNIHPSVMQWLDDNGYNYEHEYKLPDYGKVDFYATKGDESLLIEAKLKAITKVLVQLAGYGVQMPDAKLAIAVPIGKQDPEIVRIATKYNIAIIEIEPMSELHIEDAKTIDDYCKEIESKSLWLKMGIKYNITDRTIEASEAIHLYNVAMFNLAHDVINLFWQFGKHDANEILVSKISSSLNKTADNGIDEAIISDWLRECDKVTFYDLLPLGDYALPISKEKESSLGAFMARY